METGQVEKKPFLICLGVLIIAEFAASLFFAKGMRHPLVWLGLVRLGEIGAFLLVFLWSEKSLSPIGLGKGSILHGSLRGLLWSAGFGLLVLAGFGVLALLGQNPFLLFRTRMPGDMFGVCVFFLVGGFIAPVAEEIFFRGVVFGYFRRWGFVPALLISASLFSALHLTKGFPLVQTVGGLLFALSYEREKTLMTPVIIHILGNVTLFMISVIFN